MTTTGAREPADPPKVHFRRYEIKPGAMAEFIEWWLNVIPIRRRCGFELLFAYELPDLNQYVSAWEYRGDLTELESVYYADSERAALAAQSLEWAQAYETARHNGDREAAARAVAAHPGFTDNTYICEARPVAEDQSRFATHSSG